MTVGGQTVETTSTRSLAEVLLDKGQGLFTGRVDVVLGAWVGALHLTEGQIVDARVGPLSGEAALWRMLLPIAPRITVEPGRARATGGAMLGRPDALLPRAAELLALLERLAEKVGGLARVWAIRFDALQARLETLPDGIHPVLRLLDGKRAVRQVVAECPVDDVLTLRVLAKLLSEGILVLPDAATPASGLEVIDVEGGLEEALTAALAELSADDVELPAPAPPGASTPEVAPPVATSSEPPGPMPSPITEPPASTPSSSSTSPAYTVRSGGDRRSTAGGLPQHLALPRPAPPVVSADELRAWLGVEEAFFSVPPVATPAPRATSLPWGLLAALAGVAVVVGVLLGRACG
ncbi:MAG: DUF4388 domain-containing protein [Deltaproteobacteria bacterium]|nr:DUF4388 domain-containing protein [Deltaproteobacteria bacterium]